MIVITNYHLSNGHAGDRCRDSGDADVSSLDIDAFRDVKIYLGSRSSGRMTLYYVNS